MLCSAQMDMLQAFGLTLHSWLRSARPVPLDAACHTFCSLLCSTQVSLYAGHGLTGYAVRSWLCPAQLSTPSAAGHGLTVSLCDGGCSTQLGMLYAFGPVLDTLSRPTQPVTLYAANCYTADSALRGHVMLYAAEYALRFWSHSTQLVTPYAAGYARRSLSHSMQLVTLYVAGYALRSWICSTQPVLLYRLWPRLYQLVMFYAAGYAWRSLSHSMPLGTLYAAGLAQRCCLCPAQLVALSAPGHKLTVLLCWLCPTQLDMFYAAGYALRFRQRVMLVATCHTLCSLLRSTLLVSLCAAGHALSSSVALYAARLRSTHWQLDSALRSCSRSPQPVTGSRLRST